MAQTLLKVDNINVFYGNIHAVKDVSFEVNEGEIVTLIGANGAGKSTTLKTISGLLHPKTGDVLYKGKSIKGVRAHKIVEAGLAQVPEGRHVFLHMTVEENLDMGAYTQPASTIAPNKEKVFELFPRLKERRKQLAGTMSGGEQQMLAMGRALMSNASMLMLDEPSMGLSPLLVQEIFDIIQDIHKEGMTILLVEQNAQMALSVADRAYVLETGRVVMDGTGAELLTNERVRSAYLGGYITKSKRGVTTGSRLFCCGKSLDDGFVVVPEIGKGINDGKHLSAEAGQAILHARGRFVIVVSVGEPVVDHLP